MWAASFKSLYPKRPADTIQRHTCLAGRSEPKSRSQLAHLVSARSAFSGVGRMLFQCPITAAVAPECAEESRMAARERNEQGLRAISSLSSSPAAKKKHDSHDLSDHDRSSPAAGNRYR
jgi:hypothetical protein